MILTRTPRAAAACAATALGLTIALSAGTPAEAKGGSIGGYGESFAFLEQPSREGVFASVRYGRMNDSIYVGDWDGSGSDALAARRGNTYFLQEDVRTALSDRAVSFGKATDETYVGDWNGDGVVTPAVRRGNVFHFTDRWEGGAADRTVAFGKVGDRIFVGDWNGDGKDTLAIVRDNYLHLTDDLSSSRTTQIVKAWWAYSPFIYIGDWDGDGRDTIGIRFPVQPPQGKTWSDWLLFADLAGETPLPGREPGETFRAGGGKGAAFVGDWNGDGRDELGGRNF